MPTDFCAYLRTRVGDKLSKLGLEECGCRQFGEGLTGHGAMYAADVAYYQGHGLLVAIGYSGGDGTTCFVGHLGGEPTAYKEWPSLWEVVGLTKGLLSRDEAALDPDADLEAWDSYLGQFPEGRDAMIDFIALKLAELIGR